MVDAILSKRRVDPTKVEQLRDHFETLEDDRELVERALAAENVYTEAAFLRETDDEVVLYYYMERDDEFPPDVSPADLDDEIIELGKRQEAALDEACLEPAHDDDGQLKQFQTLFFASSSDREFDDQD
jgi:predicted nuclease with TOPRIM domain